MKLFTAILLTLPLLGQTQIDYNTQIKNRPVTVVATPGGLPLATALANVPSGGILLISAGSYSISTALSLAAANLAVQCQPGAVIQTSGAIFGMILTAANTTVTGCTINGGNQTGAGGFYVSGATNSHIQNSILSGQTYPILVTNSTGIFSDHNVITTAGGYGISAIDNYDGVHSSFDTITLTGGGQPPINFQTVASGAYGRNVSVDHATIMNGGANYCIQYQGNVSGLGAQLITGISDSNNNCKATSATTAGMMSIISAQQGQVHDDNFDQNGQPIGIQFIESGGYDLDIHDNIQRNAPAGNVEGININGGARTRIHDNTVQGILNIGPNPGNGGPTIHADGNSFVNNTVTIGSATTLYRGPFWAQCNVVNGSINDLLIMGNKLNDSNVSGIDSSVYLDVNSSGCTIANPVISGNHLNGSLYGISISNAGLTQNVGYFGNEFSGGTAEACPTGVCGSADLPAFMANPGHPLRTTAGIYPWLQSAPTCTPGSSAGSGASCATSVADNGAMLIALTTGTGTTAGGALFSVTFSPAMATLCIPFISPANPVAAQALSTIYLPYTGWAATGYTAVSVGGTAPLTVSTLYAFGAGCLL